MDPEISAQGFIRTTAQVYWTSSTRLGGAERGQDFEKAFTRRLCAYAGVNSTEVFRFSGRWVDQGREPNSYFPELLRATQEIQRDPFPGPGIFHFVGRC